MQTTDTPAASGGEHWIKDPAGAFGAWDRWTKATGLPIHQGYFIPDLKTVDLGWWEERQCHAAFLKLSGQEGVSIVKDINSGAIGTMKGTQGTSSSGGAGAGTGSSGAGGSSGGGR